MADSKRFFSWVLVALFFYNVAANSEISIDGRPEDEVLDPSPNIELHQLKSRISTLESSIDESAREIRGKGESIKDLEVKIREISVSLASLRSKLQSLQGEVLHDASKQVGKADSRAVELEKQIDKLRKEIAIHNSKKDAMEARAISAERKVQELSLKLIELQTINEEQKTRIRKTELALQVAEEEVRKVQLEATQVSTKLVEAHGAWLPSWLEIHIVYMRSFIVTQWNEHGRLALDLTLQKSLVVKDQVQQWMEPHVDAVKTKWIPVIKDQWVASVTSIEPRMHSLYAKTVEGYHASKEASIPYLVSVQKKVDPYFQEAKKLTKPYIDRVTTMANSRVKKANTFLKTYTKIISRGYKRFIKTTIKYHRQVRTTIHKVLKGHELTRPLATKEVVWFMASAVMALPVLLLLRMVSSTFNKKPKKRVRSSHASNTRRRTKWVHPEN